MISKKEYGVFYTQRSPFARAPFQNWMRNIPDFESRRLIEPFAGENAIPFMLSHLPNVWVAQDIMPPGRSLRQDVPVRRKDSLLSYPACARRDVAITNPPYLAKSIAVRSRIPYPKAPEDDLYKVSLRVMLERHDYVAAIVPASFLTAGDHERRIVSIDLMLGKYFEETEHPTCLALFGPPADRDWTVWKEGVLIGKIGELRRQRDAVLGGRAPGIRFNEKRGQIALLGLDKSRKEKIRFGTPDLVSDEEIKVSSRYRTRILLPGISDASAVIESANRILDEFRDRTGDVFLTPYRGLREDGDFRRRLDFGQAAAILSKALKADFGKNPSTGFRSLEYSASECVVP